MAVAPTEDVIVVGAGHNGLLAAALLARAGVGVRVLERAPWPGGAISGRADLLPGCVIDQGASILTMLRLNPALEALGLERHGLVWAPQACWGWQAAQADAPPLHFWQDVDQTCAGLEALAPRWGEAWAGLIRDSERLLDPMLRFMGTPATARGLGGLLRALPQSGPLGLRLGGSLLGVLRRRLPGPLLTPALWFCTAGVRPTAWGSAGAVLFLAMMHRLGLQRPLGGSARFVEALVACIRAHGGTVELSCPVERITPGRPWQLQAGGRTLTAHRVLAACHARTFLEHLEGAPLGHLPAPAPGHGMVLRLLTDRLPAWAEGPQAGAMQSLLPDITPILRADRTLPGQLSANPPPLMVETFSAIDPHLCPPGQHLLYVWTQGFPEPVDPDAALGTIQAALEAHDPALRGAWRGAVVQTPARMEADLGLLGGNLLHYEQRLGQLHALRPRHDLSGVRLPLPGLYLGSASAHPGGGVTGLPGLLAAQAILHDLGQGALAGT